MSYWIKMNSGGLIISEAWQTLEVHKSLKSDPPYDEQYEGKVHGCPWRPKWTRLFPTEAEACVGCVQEARRWYENHISLCQESLKRLSS